MTNEPDRSAAWLQGHFDTKAEADAYAADIEKIAGLEGSFISRTEVTRDPEGGWNVWVWD